MEENTELQPLIPTTTTQAILDSFESTVAQASRARPMLSVPDWADTFRRLSTSSGAIGGPWRTSRVEVARGPMMAVKEPGVRLLTAMTCTQLLKTSLLENVLGYFAHLDPCPMLLTQPKEGAVKSFSKERLVPMVKASPALQPIFGDERTRNADDTLSYKEFPGGFLAMESAGSPTNLAMRAIRVTLADEIDKYETTKEGDPVLLLEERTSTFKNNSLKLRTCSPTWEETSRIFKSYNEGDQRQPFVRCPHCNFLQHLEFFTHVHWAKDDNGNHFPNTAAIHCEECKAEWTESQRLRIMTTKGKVKWLQTRKFTCCGVEQEPLKTRKWRWDSKNKVGRAQCEHCEKDAVGNTHASFGHVSKLYSPFVTVVELAEKWLLAKDDPESKQTFYNTQLGLPFHAQAVRKIEANALVSHKSEYPAEVPPGVVVITCGIDVQSGSANNLGRLECEVVGWGLGEESWSLDYKVLNGDPAKPELWAELDAYLQKTWTREDGVPMFIRAACIDSGGHNTQDVYKFARGRLDRKVWAIKGASDKGGQWTPVWPVPKPEQGAKVRYSGYRPQIIGVNAAKEAVRQRLLIEEHGPGYCHFPHNYVDARFEQFAAEDLVLETKDGFTKKRWVPKRGRTNEALDARVYAYAALCGLYASKFNLEHAAQMIAQFEALPKEEKTPTTATAQPARKVRRSGFMDA